MIENMYEPQDEAYDDDLFSYDCDYVIKMILVGDLGVGKSSMLLRYADASFSTSTIGIDFKIRTVEYEDKRYNLQMWDTAGQERFRTITQSYYKGAAAVMLVYDITNRKSFENLDVWLKDIREYGELGTPIILVGAKTDLEEERSVSKEEGRKYAEDRNLIFCTETSAKYNSNVDEAFMLVIKGFMGAIDENHTIRGHSHSQVATPNSKKRCGVC